MLKQISADDALDLKDCIFIDVRSPKEYSEATIPNSINIPILTDEERELVGTVHKNDSKAEAKILGLRFASSKLEDLYRKILDLNNRYKNIVIFCWRGGMRSTSVCNVLNIMNLNTVFQLEGGYKSYRKTVHNFIENNISRFTFVVLHGLTGVGKTIILKELEKMEVPIIDLEMLANNAGSVFGNILYSSLTPSQKDFESKLFIKLYYNKTKFVVVESESKRIGSINVPHTVIEEMEKGIHVLVETSLDNRISNINNDYINQQLNQDSNNLDDEIIKALSHLKKRLGSENVEALICEVKEQNYTEVIRFLIENYYDPLYKYSIDKIDFYDLKLYYDDSYEAVKIIYDFLNEKFHIGKE